MDFTNQTRIERVAIHEAGHALVASFQSRLPEVRYVCMSPAPAGGGHCQLEATDAALAAAKGNPIALRELYEQSMRVSAAGFSAERIAFGHAELDEKAEDSDAASLVRLASLIWEIEVAQGAMTRRAKSKRKPASPPPRSRIGRLFAARLSAEFAAAPVSLTEQALRAVNRRVIECVERAFTVAEFLLRSRWGAVESIARHLIECQTIPGELVRAAIETAPNRPKFLPTVDLLKRAALADPAIVRALVRLADPKVEAA